MMRPSSSCVKLAPPSPQELIAAQAAARELGPEVLRGLELQISTQVSALRNQRARYLQSVNAALTAVGHHKSLTEAKMQELVARAGDAARGVSARAPPTAVPAPLPPQPAGGISRTLALAASLSTQAAPSLASHGSSAGSSQHQLRGAGPAPTPFSRPSALTAVAPGTLLETPPIPPFSVTRPSDGLGNSGGTRMSLSTGVARVGAAAAAAHDAASAWPASAAGTGTARALLM